MATQTPDRAPDLGNYPVVFRAWSQAIRVATIWASATNRVHRIAKEGPYWTVNLNHRRVNCQECRTLRGLPNAKR